MTTKDKLDTLKQTPSMLRELVREIPVKLLKQHRIAGKWSIHEHVCHLYDAQKMMLERFKVFKTVQNPSFSPYLPGSENTPSTHLLDLDMDECLDAFEKDRKELINFLALFSKEDWENEGHHPEYSRFSAAIFLRHIMMHDHFHMYRIEELWLTTEKFLT